jgi:hypothetical protein
MSREKTQNGKAKELGLSGPFLSQVLSGERNFGWEQSKRIAAVIGCDPAVLKDATPDKKRDLIDRYFYPRS